MGAKRSPDVDDIYNLLMSKGFQMSLEEAARVAATVIDGSCVDRNVDCERWAAAGECAANAGYMNISCPRSCGTCTPDPANPAAPVVEPETPGIVSATTDDDAASVAAAVAAAAAAAVKDEV
mmetsp:Transcript_39543/g.118118  ORF Transcript_39543/g.118118 Transcript_39543/m.118118 type:complete len:122 (-) Transcript_39543:72-437(-)